MMINPLSFPHPMRPHRAPAIANTERNIGLGQRFELYGFSTSGLCRLTGLPSMKFSIFVIASS
jgi:hypothetical protein